MDENVKTVLEWRTPEFVPHPRGPAWFLTAGAMVIALTAYAILTGSATMAIVFILLAGVYYLTHNQKPRIITVRVTELGVEVDGAFYPYNTVHSFWLVFKPPFIRRLYLNIGGKTPKQIKIELNDQDPVLLRRLLAREVPEIEGGEESLSDMFIRLLRLQ